MDKKPFQAQLDAMQGALAQQQARLQTAQANLARVKRSLPRMRFHRRTSTMPSARSRHSSSGGDGQAEVVQAQLNLSYCTIASPVTGITGAAMQQDGAYVNPLNSQLTTVAVLSPIWLISAFPKMSWRCTAPRLQRSASPPKGGDYIIEVVLVDGSVFPFTGRITFAAPSYNAQTGTFLIRASVDNPKGTLRPNQYVRARLKGPSAERDPRPPESGSAGSQGPFPLGGDKEGKTELRPVVIGDWYEDDIFISEGLRPGIKLWSTVA